MQPACSGARRVSPPQHELTLTDAPGIPARGAATTWSPALDAVTMFGPSKTAFREEIAGVDSASEPVVFWCVNAAFAQGLHARAQREGDVLAAARCRELFMAEA